MRERVLRELGELHAGRALFAFAGKLEVGLEEVGPECSGIDLAAPRAGLDREIGTFPKVGASGRDWLLSEALIEVGGADLKDVECAAL